MKLKLMVKECCKYDGTYQYLDPIALVADDGTIVNTDKDKDWEQQLEARGLEYEYRFYNDNPVVHGFPDRGLTIDKTTFDAEELCGFVDSEEPLWAEID